MGLLYPVEYIFRNSPQEDPATATLSSDALSFKNGGREIVMPCRDVRSVQLSRAGGTYSVLIADKNGRSFRVSNRYFHGPGHFDDFSPAYVAFIRVLHYHLREEKRVRFQCAVGVSRAALALAALFMLSTLTAFATDVSGWTSAFWWQIFGGCSVALTIILFVLRRWLRKSYHPENIPGDYLPSSAI